MRSVDSDIAQRYRSLSTAVGAINDFVYVFDPDGRLTYGNQRLLDLLNTTIEELPHKTLEQLGYSPDLALRLRADVRRVLETGAPVRGQTDFTAPDGSCGTYEYVFHPVLDDAGRPELVAGMSRDITAQLATERALRSYAEEQRALVEKLEMERLQLNDAQAVARIGSWVLDFRTNSLQWSAESYRIFGVEPGQTLTYESWRARVHPEDLQGVEESFLRSVKERKLHFYEHRVHPSVSKTMWVQVRCATQYDEEGRPTRSIGTVQDITDRRAAESALQHSQELLRIASHVGQIGGWQVDLVSNTVSWSDEVCAIHGVEPGFRPTVEEAINFYAPEYRQLVADAVSRSMAEGVQFDLEAQIINTRGERTWVRAIGGAERDHHGTVRHIRGAFQNISERKLAEEAVRESDERFRLAAQATSDVIWDWNLLDDDSCWFSDGLVSQFGHEQAGRGPRDAWIDLVHPEDRDDVLRSLFAAIQRGESWKHEYRLRRGDGSYAQVIDRGRFATDEHGRGVRMIGAIVDVTQQRALERQLDQVNRVATLGQLAANMAHEFNNVLMSIQPFAEVIRRAAPEEPRITRAVTSIRTAVERGRKVTEQILRFTRRVEPVRRTISVDEWLDGFRSEAEALLDRAISFDVRETAHPLFVAADVAQLNQVLANLLLNARDASPAGSRIEVSADEWSGADGQQKSVHIIVRDWGSGIPQESLVRVFDPLFTTKREGNGLGLAICHQVITAHDGRIWAESPADGGAAFHILLPLSEMPLAATATVHPGRSAGPSRVLIVEDESAVAEGLSAMLALEEVQTHVVSEGRGAVTAIETFDPDVILLDVGLPDVSGVEVCHDILARWPKRKVVFMTGHLSRRELDSLLVRPHVGFLAKPFSMEMLLTALAAV